MGPADIARKFVIGIGAIVDNQIGSLNKPKNVLVGAARDMFGVGYIANRLAVILNPVAGGAVRVIQGRGSNNNPIAEIERVARAEIPEINIRVEYVKRHRKQRFGHCLAQGRLDTALGRQMTGANVDLAAGAIGQAEIWHADNMIPMGVRKEMIDLNRVVGRQAQAQRPEPGTPIENKPAIAIANFNAGGVPTIALGFGALTGY